MQSELQRSRHCDTVCACGQAGMGKRKEGRQHRGEGRGSAGCGVAADRGRDRRCGESAEIAAKVQCVVDGR